MRRGDCACVSVDVWRGELCVRQCWCVTRRTVRASVLMCGILGPTSWPKRDDRPSQRVWSIHRFICTLECRSFCVRQYGKYACSCWPETGADGTPSRHVIWLAGRRLFFFGVYSWLVKVLGQFSIIYFRGLGLRIGVRVWVRVRVGVRVWVRARVRVRVRVSVVLWSE